MKKNCKNCFLKKLGCLSMLCYCGSEHWGTPLFHSIDGSHIHESHVEDVREVNICDEWVSIINMTPHEINLFIEVGEINLPSSGTIRLEEKINIIGNIGGVPIIEKKFFAAKKLPPEIDGVYYIVSLIVAQTYPQRKDFLVIGETIRDENGRIAGCKSFAIL